MKYFKYWRTFWVFRGFCGRFIRFDLALERDLDRDIKNVLF